MILGVWQLLTAYAMVTTLFAIAGAWQRAMSLMGMVTWIIVAFGATNLELASNGQVLSNPDPSVAILAFVSFGFCLVFFGASFARSEDDDDAPDTGEDLLGEQRRMLGGFRIGRSP